MSEFFDKVKVILESEDADYTTVGEAFMYESVPKDFPFASKVVDSYGGEDCGSEYYSVYEFTDGSDVCRVRFDGHYQSHYGVDYIGFREVTKKIKTITVWE